MTATKTPVCDFSLKAPEFSLPNTDGKTHTDKSSMGENGLLIMFICNHCPFVQAILDKIVRDTKELESHGIRSVAIMSNDINDYPEDSPQNMKSIAAQHQFSFPYLYDESQEIAKTYGAVCTPDFLGYNRNFELQYRGRLDASGMNDQEGLERDLFNAMRLVADTQKGPAQQIASMGCSIKWK